MHRYFFDLDAGTWDARDTVGVVLTDAGAAHAEAVAVPCAPAPSIRPGPPARSSP